MTSYAKSSLHANYIKKSHHVAWTRKPRGEAGFPPFEGREILTRVGGEQKMGQMRVWTFYLSLFFVFCCCNRIAKVRLWVDHIHYHTAATRTEPPSRCQEPPSFCDGGRHGVCQDATYNSRWSDLKKVYYRWLCYATSFCSLYERTRLRCTIEKKEMNKWK